MKKIIELNLVVLVISFLTSCASPNVAVLPEMTPETERVFTSNEGGTLEITGQDMITEPTHWLYVQDDHWSGSYIRCKGEINSCKKVATDSKLDVGYIFSQTGP